MTKTQPVTLTYDGLPFGHKTWTTYWDSKVHECTVVGVKLKGNHVCFYDLVAIVDGRECCFSAEPCFLFDTKLEAVIELQARETDRKNHIAKLFDESLVKIGELEDMKRDLSGGSSEEGDS
jgi:hypothetical protein